MNKQETIDDLLERLRVLLSQDIEPCDRTFGEVLEEYLATMQREGREKSYKLYRLAGERLQAYRGGDFLLSDLHPTIIRQYAEWLRAKKISETTIRIYLTLNRVVLNYAIKMGYVNYKVHPFVLCKMPTAAVRHTELTIGELRRLRDARLPTRKLGVVRDLFMLTYYLGGMNLKDLLAYDFGHNDTLCYVRQKTRHTKLGPGEVMFSIQPEAAQLIGKYIQPDGRLAFAGYRSYEQVYSFIYRHIGRLGECIRLSHRLNYYAARKSFAQHCYNMGAPIEVIEYCIGHTMKSNRPIFNYIHIMQEQADSVFRRLFDSL